MAVSNGANTAAAIREAAANLFHRHGYEATSLREIASQVGIQVGSLYNHIGGKSELLRDIMVGIMDDLLAAMDEAIRAPGSPLEVLKRAVDCHLRFHATHSRDVFIGNAELRALPAEDRRAVIARRDRYEHLLRQLVSDVVETLPAQRLDVRLQTYAILAIGSHVSSWYRDQGSMSLDDMVAGYTAVILRQLGVPPAGDGFAATRARIA
jgi:TetR/AcrR family transcriptional regulator, cholesterol catabolism regulator